MLQPSETAADLVGICSKVRRSTFKHIAKEKECILLPHYIETLLSIAGKQHMVACLGLAGKEKLDTFHRGVYGWCAMLAAAKGLKRKKELLVSPGMQILY